MELLFSVLKIVAVILFFGASIFIHELGHYWAAKWRGLKIDRFSVGFGPKIFSWTNRDGVEWRISWIPLGGYVALPEMAEMGMVEGNPKRNENDGNSEKENEFSSIKNERKNLQFFDKFSVAVAGPLFNVVFAIGLSILIWQIGKPSSETENTTRIGFIAPELVTPSGRQPSPALKGGLLPGDIILEVDGRKVDNFNHIRQGIALGSGRTAEGVPEVTLNIRRGENTIKKTLNPQLVSTNLRTGDEIRTIGIGPANRLIIQQFQEDSPASQSGLLTGDQITHCNDNLTYSIRQLNQQILRNIEKVQKITVDRSGKTLDFFLKPASFYTTLPLVVIASGTDRLVVRPTFAEDFSGKKTDLSVNATLIVHEVILGHRKAFSGIKYGQSLQSLNGMPVESVDRLLEMMKSVEKQGMNAIFSIGDQTYIADDKPVAELVAPQVSNRLGILFSQQTSLSYPNPYDQITEVFRYTLMMVKSFLHPQSDVGIGQLNSPLGIGRAIHTFLDIDLRLGLWFILFLNVNLAVMNLLPIPVLDGGHILFALITKIRGRSLPVSAVNLIQSFCMFALLGLMLFTVTRDTQRWEGDLQAEQDFIRKEAIRIKPEFIND